MKKKEREKQLLVVEKFQLKRLMFVRMVKFVMQEGSFYEFDKFSFEEEKKMVMRKVIVDRLKVEMLGK